MSARPEQLTNRERECLRLVHEHLSSKEIARALGIRPGTVDKHCESAVRKLKVESRTAAAVLLARSDTPPIQSHPEAFAMADALQPRLSSRVGETTDERYIRTHACADVERPGDHPARDGLDGRQASDGAPPSGGHPQAGAFHDAFGGHDRTVLHSVRNAGRAVHAGSAGHADAARLLVILGIAAGLVWLLTAIAGAEQFAFLLQRLRYDG